MHFVFDIIWAKWAKSFTPVFAVMAPFFDHKLVVRQPEFSEGSAFFDRFDFSEVFFIAGGFLQKRVGS